jgi:hypothetical protein
VTDETEDPRLVAWKAARAAAEARGRKLPGYLNPSDEIEHLINALIVAVDKSAIGRFRIHFYEGGLVDINLNKTPAKRRRVLEPLTDALTSAPVRKF